MNELFTAENLKNGGLTLALLYSIYINYKMSRDHAKIVGNHINHATESQTRLTSAVEKLIKFLEKKFK